MLSMFLLIICIAIIFFFGGCVFTIRHIIKGDLKIVSNGKKIITIDTEEEE